MDKNRRLQLVFNHVRDLQGELMLSPELADTDTTKQIKPIYDKLEEVANLLKNVS